MNKTDALYEVNWLKEIWKLKPKKNLQTILVSTIATLKNIFQATILLYFYLKINLVINENKPNKIYVPIYD